MFGLIERYRAKLNLEVALSKLDFLLDEMEENRSSQKDLIYWSEQMGQINNPYLDGVKNIQHIRKSYGVHYETFLKKYCSDSKEDILKIFYNENCKQGEC